MGVTQIMLGTMKNSMLKWYENTLHMEDNRRPKPILTWLPKGRRQRRRPAIKW
jgi:hypothetical protein